MRISELSRRSDVPVATIKFYLREGLVPAGELTSATQAQYGEQHLERLRLVRALVAGVGMPLGAVRQVLDLIDHPPDDVSIVFGRVQELLTPTSGAPDTGPARALVQKWGWFCEDGYEAPLRRLAVALEAATEAGFTIPDGVLDRYAEAMRTVAEIEIANTPAGSLSEAVRYTVLGSVLMEPVLLAIRRLAEAEVAVAALNGDRPNP